MGNFFVRRPIVAMVIAIVTVIVGVVFLGGLLMLALIAYFSIRVLSRQDRALRQAAMVFAAIGSRGTLSSP